MNTLMLAIRNLLRNRRRSLTTVLTMVVGLTAILLFGGYRSNIMYGSLTGFVQYTGHLQIQRSGYFLDGSDNPGAYGIRDYRQVIQALRDDAELRPMLRVVTPTLQLGGIAGNFAAGISRSVMAVGIVPEERNAMLRWNQYGVKSYALPMPLEGQSIDAVVVGQGVARKLKLCSLLQDSHCRDQRKEEAKAVPKQSANESTNESAGSSLPDDISALSALEKDSQPVVTENRIEMLAATSGGAPNVASLQAIKANNMGIKALDDIYMAMHLQQAQRLIYGKREPEVTALMVQLELTQQIPQARARIAALLKEKFPDQTLDVLDFEALNPTYGQTNQFMDSMFSFIAMLIGVIVLFTIGNTMSTAVVERTAEIGTLRAIGLRRSGIRRLFLCEALVLGVIGAILGALCALAVAYLINHSGWTWTPPGYSYAYLILVRVGQDLPLLIGSMLSMIIVTTLSAWWPANRAAQFEIVDALRHV
ncbi:MAG: ABC transporter permease [Undibacterium curvum]|uniref:ABC transporter permease n=1 Tax=Undibacterium curvum TaxID=2762294 RepID=UPI003BDFCA3D